MAEIIQPGKAQLDSCVVGGVPYFEGDRNNYHVQELRIFEDHCKAYFTGQLIIEAHQNTWEAYVRPGNQVSITFTAPRSDGGPSNTYTENFKIYSYESKPRQGDFQNAMVITLSLMGEEYYRDRFSTVMMPFSNITGTAAAAVIHNMYMAVNGGLEITSPSIGMIGSTQVPHEVRNEKPIKAIHGLLDKSVFAAYPSCAPTYFRTKPGYIIGPLQQLLETAPVVETFLHQPAQGVDIIPTLVGYNRVINLRPMSPPNDQQGKGGAGSAGGSPQGFFDIAKGQVQKLTGGGGRGNFSVLDTLHQALSIAKNGPGGFQSAEDAFLAQLSLFTPKFWVSVPLQTGTNVTCGTRINVQYPFTDQGIVSKTMYVARLIHELKFTEGEDRQPVTINGTTDMFGVAWGQ